MPRYRIQAQEIARQEGLLGSNDSSRKGRGKKISKQEEEAILKQIVEQKLDIKGGYKKPSKFISLSSSFNNLFFQVSSVFFGFNYFSFHIVYF